jgi:hypothetical protein
MNLTPSLSAEDLCAICGDEAQGIVTAQFVVWGSMCVYLTPVCRDVRCIDAAKAAIGPQGQTNNAQRPLIV